jgi:murein DD-endopeptidase MepM/ murein hydrolase activator NlpD
MSKDIEKIYSSFDKILEEKKSIMNEVAASSTSLFGGTPLTIPVDGSHKGQEGWQSNNAWDIKADIGTPVYAVADGTVLTYSDYGPTPVHKNGKTLFGAGFTVDSANGLPDVYYTHLQGVTVRPGSKIECGQLLGYVMDFPGSSYDHLHIGVESGHNVREFLNSDGTLKCGGGTITGESPNSTQSSTVKPISMSKSSDDYEGDELVGQLVAPFSKMFKPGLKEQKSPKDKFYLQFCNVTDTLVKNGQQISRGQLIGKTSEDVEVSKLDNSYYRLNITKNDFDLGNNLKNNFGVIVIPKDSNEKIKSPVSGVINNSKYNSGCKNQITIEYYVDSKTSVEPTKKKFKSEPQYGDPVLAALVGVPFKLFQNKYNKDTGELEKKRFGRPGDGRPIDPLVKDVITAPFKKIGDIFRKKQNEEEEHRKTKKVNENIDRIKKLL